MMDQYSSINGFLNVFFVRSNSSVSHQCVEIVANQSSIVDDVSFEDNEEEEESQHHVAQVTKDVVECTVNHNISESVREKGPSNRNM